SDVCSSDLAHLTDLNQLSKSYSSRTTNIRSQPPILPLLYSNVNPRRFHPNSRRATIVRPFFTTRKRDHLTHQHPPHPARKLPNPAPPTPPPDHPKSKRRSRSPAAFPPHAPCRNRTYNLVIKSHLLCQLS